MVLGWGMKERPFCRSDCCAGVGWKVRERFKMREFEWSVFVGDVFEGVSWAKAGERLNLVVCTRSGKCDGR